jgi:hypothetical protein
MAYFTLGTSLIKKEKTIIWCQVTSILFTGKKLLDNCTMPTAFTLIESSVTPE